MYYTTVFNDITKSQAAQLKLQKQEELAELEKRHIESRKHVSELLATEVGKGKYLLDDPYEHIFIEEKLIICILCKSTLIYLINYNYIDIEQS